jgi:hypothetical protein
MRHYCKVFDGSSFMFEKQGDFRTSIRYAIWFGQFTPVRQNHLVSVLALLHTLCSLGICCTLTGLYPAYIAGFPDSHYFEEGFQICHSYIPKSTSAIMDPNSEKHMS